MDELALILSLFGASAWIILLALPWQPWRNDQVVEARRDLARDLSSVTVVIPARNEADHIGETLASLAEQGVAPKVILVDDGSTDGTAALARKVSGLNLTIIEGAPLPAGWSGKLWALEQGVGEVDTPLTLLLDADICLEPGAMAGLLEKMRYDRIQFLSVMASLRMVSWWERLLIPAFIYFFKLIYPFRLANSVNRRFSAAAGGCILLETRVLGEVGAFASIKDELIDDCSLARQVKSAGHKIWIGQSHSVISRRCYDQLQPIWDMVARTAFTQLRYSGLLLALCVISMAIVYGMPVLGLIYPDSRVFWSAVIGLAAMMASYLPTLRYYGLSPAWAPLLPVVAGFYMAMTLSSAFRYWRGERSRWKDRIYSSPA
jgi:hopene-associated glycosyltransferase HpnB